MLTCPTCGKPLIQKPRGRLLTVGCTMLGIAGIAFITLPLWFIPATVILGLTAIYLIVWGTLGKARWCRCCKTFPMVHK